MNKEKDMLMLSALLVHLKQTREVYQKVFIDNRSLQIYHKRIEAEIEDLMLEKLGVK